MKSCLTRVNVSVLLVCLGTLHDILQPNCLAQCICYLAGQMLEVSCRDAVRLRIFEGNRLLAMLQDEPNVFLACSDSVIMNYVKERLSHTARNRITAHPQDAVMQAQRWSRNQPPYIFGSMQRGSDSAVVHFWAQKCTADKAKRLPALHVKANQQSMLLLRGDSNLDGSPRLLLGIVYFKGPLLNLVVRRLPNYSFLMQLF